MPLRPLTKALCVVAALLALAACHTREAPNAHDPLIAYIVPNNSAWFQPGEVKFIVTHEATPVVTWTKDVTGGTFSGLSNPEFTADGKYVFAGYSSEDVGRYPYDGSNVHAEIVWADTATHQTHEVDIPARSRDYTVPPGRPGAPYALQGSVITWESPAPVNAPDGQLDIMQLDLSQPNPTPHPWHTVQLPARVSDTPYQSTDFTGAVIGVGGGRVVIAKKYGDDQFVQADRLFLVDPDGSVRTLSEQPTTHWVSATFSPDGSRIAYETGALNESTCSRHQITVFDVATGQQAAGFPHGPFDASPQPFFYVNDDAAVWWSPDGKLRTTGSAERCPTDQSQATSNSGVWQLDGTGWTQVAPEGTLRDYPLPNGGSVVITSVTRSADKPNIVAELAIRRGGKTLHVADLASTEIAVGNF